MKKIFLFAFVAFLFFTPFVSASASIAWTPDVISGLGDLGYSLIGGASFDFKNSKYIEGAVDVDDALAEQQASQFLADYCLSRGIGLLNPDELPTSDYEYFKTYYFNSITNKAWNDFRLAQTQAEQDEALRFELSNSLFAQWTGYNKLWYKNYIENFASESDDIIVNPNPLYLNFLDVINGSGFSFSNYNQYQQGGGYDHYKIFPLNLLSYSFNTIQYNDSSFNNLQSYIVANNPLTANITSNNDVYTVSLYSDPVQEFLWSSPDEYYNYGYFTQSNYINGGRPYISAYSYDLQPLLYNKSGTLDQCLYFLANNFRNINIYVDGVCWALAFDPAPSDPVIPDFNDIIDIDTDDPAYDIVVPVDGVPAWFDLTSLFDAIKLAIIDAKNGESDTDGVLNIDLALDNDVVIDDTGTVVDTKDESIDDVLDTPAEIDKTKDYPVIPLYTPPIQNAFKGTSILAELIDGTQTVLPDELILTFWGIVFVIFILGLLKILHK